MNRQIEILAPVGGSEQLEAALRCGADAVYFGMHNFNARRNADNFDDAGLKDIIADCHVHATKVYITLNTLIKDSEMAGMHAAADLAVQSGADALIVQDLAVAAYLKKAWPGVGLFASTQMAVHNTDGVRILQDYGFDRVVLARELSLEEISDIIAKTRADCEVFVHGAHCMSVSGNCYLSAMIGGRSGNRGLCAQPCRLDWNARGRNFALSLKDLSFISHIRELEEAGVRSLKIEGRMKRAEYVASAVTACAEARCGNTPDMGSLRAVFSRSGFSDGYLTGKRDIRMFGIRTKEDVTAAKNVLSELAQLYRKENPRVPVSFELEIKEALPAVLRASDGTNTVITEGEIPEAAVNHPLTAEVLETQLKKTGGTPFFAEKIRIDLDENLNLNISKINELRRKALDGLEEKRKKLPERIRRDFQSVELPKHKVMQTEIRARFENAGQITDEADRIILPLDVIYKQQELIDQYKDRLFAEVPAMVWPQDAERTREKLEQLATRGLSDILIENIGAVLTGRRLGLRVHGGPYLNVFNSEAIKEYARIGLEDVTLSFELSFDRIKQVKGDLPRGIVTYGYLPLMKFRNCPGKGEKGCDGCTGQFELTDRMHETFPVICRDRRYSELLNCVPIYTGDKHIPTTDFETLYFTIESAEECAEILRAYRNKEKPVFRRTGGLYFRDVQ